MVETQTDFMKRLKHIGRKHAKMANGYTTRVGKDGLIVIKPRRARRGSPVKMLALLGVCFFGFKAFMLTEIGPVTYEERLAVLAGGTVVEQAGAKAMAIDPVTGVMADLIRTVRR